MYRVRTLVRGHASNYIQVRTPFLLQTKRTSMLSHSWGIDWCNLAFFPGKPFYMRRSILFHNDDECHWHKQTKFDWLRFRFASGSDDLKYAYSLTREAYPRIFLCRLSYPDIGQLPSTTYPTQQALLPLPLPSTFTTYCASTYFL